MKLLKRLVTLAWVLALLVTGCVLYLFNSETVTIDLVWFRVPTVSLAVALMSTFVIGLVTGGILSILVSIWPHRKRNPS
jgi:uncharacterized metal-binding protein